MTADDAQMWRQTNTNFDWHQSTDVNVRIIGRGVADVDDNLYFVGTKSYADPVTGDFLDDQNIFVARINADDTLGWTKEVGVRRTSIVMYLLCAVLVWYE